MNRTIKPPALIFRRVCGIIAQCWLLVAGRWSLVGSSWLLVKCIRQLPATSYQLPKWRVQMRIAIDGRALTGRFTGDRTYWRGLLNALPDCDDGIEYLVYSRSPVPEGELRESAAMRTRVVTA